MTGFTSDDWVLMLEGQSVKDCRAFTIFVDDVAVKGMPFVESFLMFLFAYQT